MKDDIAQRHYAHKRVTVGQEYGWFVKPDRCEWCGAKDCIAHHEDYARPLGVIWICWRCHVLRHQELKYHRGPAWKPIQLPALTATERDAAKQIFAEYAIKGQLKAWSARSWAAGWINDFHPRLAAALLEDLSRFAEDATVWVTWIHARIDHWERAQACICSRC